MKRPFLGVLCVMAFLKALTAHSKEPPLHQRFIQLPDAKMQFSMTEDFSKDMPAAPLVEKVTADMLSGIKKPGDRFVIGRRWWDLKPPGFFKKAWGSMQMTISVGGMLDQVKKTNAHQADQARFMVFYHDSLIDKWSEHNKSIPQADFLQFGIHVSSLFGATGQVYYSNFNYKKAGDAIVLEAGAAQDANIYYYYSVPVDANYFVEFEFIGAPDLRGSPYQFQIIVRERVKAIMGNLSIQYSKKSIPTATGGWVEASSIELLKPDTSILPKPISIETIQKLHAQPEK
jgi:hypothetical protein